MAKKVKIDVDLSTEEKIKEAASKVFTKKGYAATRTRDIADEAGINLALLNYYFRSKEKLFNLVMADKVKQLFGILGPILNDSNITLDTKITKIVSGYIAMLTTNPDLPIFVLSEIRNNTEEFAAKNHLGDFIRNSDFAKQLKEKRPDINSLHFIMNMLGMVVFPFIGKPALQTVGVVDDKQFKLLMEERQRLIPLWMKAILKVK
jgi:AcrR family transcriptional regulator